MSRLVDAKKRDQEGNKKLATRELLLGDGLSEERQARELVSESAGSKDEKADCLEILLVTALLPRILAPDPSTCL